ncbi:hypothetical protein QZM22_21200 [Burkholderia oklahomensis]|uniref:hypothetical protein n=1 Tax=Burkholderia oklahomensis TaxID=342113 RepID=UPI00264DCA9D|nr:hypothetical protein [Burkholderia oklahomensis]MDN7674968.1 hypothetical protein [Burkholderia oklahomensis]
MLEVPFIIHLASAPPPRRFVAAVTYSPGARKRRKQTGGDPLPVRRQMLDAWPVPLFLAEVLRRLAVLRAFVCSSRYI